MSRDGWWGKESFEEAVQKGILAMYDKFPSPRPFHGATLFLVEQNNEPYTPMKPIVEGMGLDWRTQQRNLAANQSRWGMVILTIPSQSGGQETLCMHLRKTAAWLITISPNKVKPEIREKILQYQNECDDVLWAYWTKGHAANPRMETITPAQQHALQQIVAHRAQDSGKLRAEIWSRFDNHFKVARYSQLPASRFEEAKTYLETLELRGRPDDDFRIDSISIIQKARMEKKERSRKRWQRKLARQQKGSQNRKKTKRRLARSFEYAKNVKKDVIHKATHDLVSDPDRSLFVVEDLKIKNMTRTPEPKKDESGRYVRNGARAKAGLNRAILASCWGLFVVLLSYKARRAGKLVLKVSPQFSSQECARCGHIHPDNRPSQAGFVCQRCGLTDNADHNASRVIAKRGIRLLLEGNAPGAGSENSKR